MCVRALAALLFVSVACCQEPAPVFTAEGVVSAATFAPGLTPGGLATVFGTGLTTGVDGIIRAAGFPMPGNLHGTMLLVNGVAAPLTAIAGAGVAGQINFQAPLELAGATTAVLQVRNGQTLSAPVTVSVFAFQPGIFTSDGRRGLAVHATDYSLVAPDNPARRGETIVIYATGLGPVTPPIGTGVAADPQNLMFAANPVGVVFATEHVTPMFAGLAPGFAGLFQINVTVPDDAPTGDIALSLEIAGASSPSVLLAVL
jgi:minor extracellular serine protease Vpr